MPRPTPKPVLRILLVEDDPRRVAEIQAWMPDGRLVHAPSAGAAIGLLKRDHDHSDGLIEHYSGLMLDHDLGDSAMTAADRSLNGKHVVAKVLETTSRDVPVLVHSTNDGGAAAMVQALRAGGFADVEQITWGPDLTMDRFLGWFERVRERYEEYLDELEEG